MTDEKIIELFQLQGHQWTSDSKNAFLHFIKETNKLGFEWRAVKKNGALRFRLGFRPINPNSTSFNSYIRIDGPEPEHLIFGRGRIRIFNNDDIKYGKKNSLHIKSNLISEILEALSEEAAAKKENGYTLEGAWPSIETATEDAENSDETEENAEKQINHNCKLHIYYGPPGTGKTKALISRIKDKSSKYLSGDGSRYTFVTFHQSYGYEEFVEGIKPVLSTDATNSESSGSVSYKVEDGVFKKLCKTAQANSGKRYAMVIDEINRGNISKIFGELITLIEPSKRIGGDEYVPVTLPYSGEEFGVPPNLDIYGSMNTADRSLALLDTALRRRFNFVAVYPDASHLEDIAVYKNGEDTGIKLNLMLDKINQRIEALYDRDHTIGHGYFLAECEDDVLDFEDLQNIFKEKIIPLLEEYFFEDKAKIALVLGDGTKANNPNLRFYKEKRIDFGDLFGTHIESGHAEPKTAYALNPAALTEVESYIGIYQASAA